MKILITGATSALAYKLNSKLNNPDAIMGDYLELPEFMLKSKGMIKLPSPQEDSYTHKILTLCLDNGIETIYLLTQQEADVLFLSEQLFKEYNISIINGETAV